MSRGFSNCYYRNKVYKKGQWQEAFATTLNRLDIAPAGQFQT
jgi:hypothetical protein